MTINLYYTSYNISSLNLIIKICYTEKGIFFIGLDKKELYSLYPLYNFNFKHQENTYYKNLIEDFLSNKFTFNHDDFDLHGTEFQKDVWNNLKTIEWGNTISYQDLAIRMEKESSVRAIATAIGKNPILFLIPCHRIIGKDKKLHGYRSGIDLKEKILKYEKELKN